MSVEHNREHDSIAIQRVIAIEIENFAIKVGISSTENLLVFVVCHDEHTEYEKRSWNSSFINHTLE
jgi:hypothetical protein